MLFQPDGAPQRTRMPTRHSFPRILADAWTHALPGREAAARDSVLRALHRLLMARRLPDRRPQLRLVSDVLR